ncbi:MAG TPA: hypothetical protein PKX91_03850 [Clostridia bacterium]|jgi:hypothetical protein|nr:hypothetical protein [Clostridia bacterium]
MNVAGLKSINEVLSCLKNDIKYIIEYYKSNFSYKVDLDIAQYKRNGIVQDDWFLHCTKISTISDELENHSTLHKQLVNYVIDYSKQRNYITQLISQNKIYLSVELDNILEELEDALSFKYTSDCFGTSDDYIPECIFHCVEESENIFKLLDSAFLISKKDYSSITNQSEKSIMKDLIWCCSIVQDDITYSLKKLKQNDQNRDIENARNRAIRNLLSAKDYVVLDQSQCGRSPSGKNSGEVDLKIEYDSMPVTYLEGLNQKNSLNKNYVKEHINKIYGYDAAGTAFNFIMVYFDGNNFENFYSNYLSLIKKPSTYEKYKLVDVIEDTSRYSEIKIYCSNLKRDGVDTKIYHLLIKFTCN